jgi:hypothetical protein
MIAHGVILQVDLVTAVRLATLATSILVGLSCRARCCGGPLCTSVPITPSTCWRGVAVALIGVWTAKKYARASLEQRVVAIVRLRP